MDVFAEIKLIHTIKNAQEKIEKITLKKPEACHSEQSLLTFAAFPMYIYFSNILFQLSDF